MYRKRMQLSVFAVVALAIVAVAAVMLLAGGAPAQATTATVSPNDEGGAPQQTDPTPTPPRHTAPEPCPGVTGNDNTEAASVVDSGHVALFDVYWNPVEGELTNNPCPPTVEHVPAQPRKGNKPATLARDDRSPSNIDITAEPPTIIHIPNSAKVDLSTDATYTATKYPKVKQADDLENRDGSNTGDGMVWVLPACPPDGSAAADDLCISFSADLLNPLDWVGDITFHVDHVHQIDIDKQDPRYVLVHDVPADGASVAGEPLWNSSDASKSEVSVAAGGYKRPMWFFTDRGTYEFQVHIQGEPDHAEASERPDGLDPVSAEASVTSDVREYIVHVGAEADLGVGVTAVRDGDGDDNGDGNLDPGEDVTITVTASNAGPDQAPNTKVNVTLPSELVIPTGVMPQATKGAYADGVWTIGSMCETTVAATGDEPECPQEATLTITAEVDSNTRGQTLTVEATVTATEPVQITETVDGTETVKTYQVPVLDTNPDNDTAAGVITVQSILNDDPMFHIAPSVPENSPTGTLVGDPVAVKEPNTDDTLIFQPHGHWIGQLHRDFRCRRRADRRGRRS